MSTSNADQSINSQPVTSACQEQSIQEDKRTELKVQKVLQEKNEQLTALLEAKHTHTTVINALSGVFYALYYIDVPTNTIQQFVSTGDRSQITGKVDDAQEFLYKMVEEFVMPEHKTEVKEFLALNTVDARMGSELILSKEYVVQTGNWTRGSLIPAAYDKNGKIEKLLYCLRNIDTEKEQEATQQGLIQALALPYENVYLINADTGKSDHYRLSKDIKDRYGSQIASGNYEESIAVYIDQDVLEEDRPLFDKVRYISNIDELLEKSGSYSFNYRVNRKGTIQFYQLQIVKTLNNHHDFILAFKNVDAMVKEEQEHLRLQAEQHRIINALSQEYHSLFKINTKTRELSLYRTDGVGINSDLLSNLMFSSSYETVINTYVNNFVVKEDQERIKKAVTLENLLESVPEVGLYKLSYQRNMLGEVSYYEMNVAKTVDENGVVIFIMGLRDVSEEMQIRLEQAHNIEAQSEIIEGIGSDYYLVLLVNPRTDSVTTYRAVDAEGKAVAAHFQKFGYCWSKGIQSYAEENVSDASRDEFLEKLSLKHMGTDGENYSFIYERCSQDGIVYLQARVSFVWENTDHYVAVVSTRNVDMLIKKERQQEIALQEAFNAAEAANKAKSDFLSNMSHDIRTPMNGIIGMTAIAAANIHDPERVQDCLTKITHASKHMLNLINEVLDMSKIESGKVDLIEEEFNLSDLIDNLLSMTASQIEEHHHELSVSLSNVEHEEVIGDSLRIQKVFVNLIGNAVKFTPDGGKIRIEISEKPSNQNKFGCYEFIFEDNGIGMEEEFLEHIFEPFVRSTDTRVNKIQGTGLGMPISRNIVRMMGGDIKVESKPGKGSKFTVTIYLKLQEKEASLNEKLIDLNVLVVDNDELSLDSCCGILNDMGMKAEGVSSGEEAVERVAERHNRKRDYFACIIDWKMPGMNGIETTRAIRKEVGNDVPIIIISAYDWSDIEFEARAAGANAFISKPLFRSRLAHAFNVLIENEEEAEGETLITDPYKCFESLNLTNKRALLVEDNDLNAEVALDILTATGLSVDRASDGDEAVDLVFNSEDGYYDIVLMDIRMPRMNGYDATRAIRASSRQYCKQIPIIAMTANAFAEDVLAAKTAGMNEHLSKPIDLKELAKALQKWIF